MEKIKLVVPNSLCIGQKVQWKYRQLHDLELDNLTLIGDQGETAKLTYIPPEDDQ